jgi:hypothetical protein
MVEKLPLGVHFAGRIQVLKTLFVGDDMNQHLAIPFWIQATFIQHSGDKVDGPELMQKARVEGDFIDPVEDVAGRKGCFLTIQRIDLHDDDVLRVTVIGEGVENRIAGIPTVPVIFTVERFVAGRQKP